MKADQSKTIYSGGYTSLRELIGLFSQAAEMLFPAFCLVCGRRIAKGGVCYKCRAPAPLKTTGRCCHCYQRTSTFKTRTSEIRLNSEIVEICHLCTVLKLPYRSQRYLWHYDRDVRDLISAMKFNPSLKIARYVAKLAAQEFKQAATPRWDLIIPMPASRRSLRERGFNQCLPLAEEIKKTVHNRKLSWAEKKALYTAPGKKLKRQAQLSHNKRLRNVAGSFIARADLLKNKHVLLIDDVITTGATSAAAAYALQNAGAKSTDLFALAISPSWQSHRYQINRFYDLDLNSAQQ